MIEEKIIPPITLILKLFQKAASELKASGINANAVVIDVVKIGLILSKDN